MEEKSGLKARRARAQWCGLSCRLVTKIRNTRYAIFTLGDPAWLIMLRELSRTGGIGLKAAGSIPELFSEDASLDQAPTCAMIALS
jgi:hypothetical protein